MTQIPAEIEQYRVPDTGLFLGLTDAQYRALPYPSFSSLKAWATGAKQPNERATLVGNVLHTWLLRGADTVKDQYKSVDEDFDLTTTAGKERHVQLRQENPGKTIVRKKEATAIKAMRDAVLANPLFRSALGADGGNEVVCVTGVPETGLVLKGMIDMRRPRAKPVPLILDLKTTGYRSENEFRNAVGSFGYFVQAAIYCDLYLAATNTGAGFAWPCVSTQPPHNTWFVPATNEQIEHGRFVYRSWANLWTRFNQKGDNHEP